MKIKIPRPKPFHAPEPKDPCYALKLSAESQRRAAEADAMGNLDLWNGKLFCECGQKVSAKKPALGDLYEPVPRPHERYKEPRRPPTKPGPRK